MPSASSILTLKEAFKKSLERESRSVLLDEGDLANIEQLLATKAQSFLFEAQTGLGTELARYFFALKNCPDIPCASCSICETVFFKAHPDFIVVAPEGSEIVRRQVVEEILRFALETPVISDFKIIVIEEAHLLNIEAANALLKVLEEPPASTVFVLTTEKPELLLPTIYSRLSRLKFSSKIEHFKQAVVYSLVQDFALSLNERKSLHNLDKKLKQIVDKYAQEEASFLKQRLDYLSKVDFDSKLKKKIINLEKQKYERLKKKYELDLLFAFLFELKRVLNMVIEMKAGGTSFLGATQEQIDVLDLFKRYNSRLVASIQELIDEAVELLSSEVKPEYVLKGVILKSWMVVS